MLPIRVFFFLWLSLVFLSASEHNARIDAVNAWLVEDAALADALRMPDLAASRRADIGLTPMETSSDTHDDLLPPIPRLDGNPVVKDFLQRLRAKVLEPDLRFPKGPEGGHARTAEGWAFIVRANELLKLVEAFCHPQSPLRDGPTLIAPILRRLAFFAEYMAPGGPVLGDFGPCGTIADAYLILTTCRPEIIPPSVRNGMDDGIQNNAHLIIFKNPLWFQPPSATTPCLVNSDVNLVLALAIAQRLFPNPAFADAVQHGLAYIEPHILPDGATNYVEQQNECPSYHATAIRSLVRTAQITGDSRPLEMVKRLRWYYPLSVSSTGVAEWSTAASWHHYWNTATGSDCAAVLAAILDCPHNQRVANLANSGIGGDLWQASYWNPNRPAAPWPDHFTTYDRNIEGPRATYGTWSTVGTTRKTHDKRGKSSYVGCVIESGKKENWPLDAALQDAGMEIRLDPAKDSDTEHRGRITLANGEPITTCAVGDHASALGAVARLGAYGQPATDWTTRQAWLFTPERLVGLIELELGSETRAAGIFGSLFLVSGRGSWGIRKELQNLGHGEFTYGNLSIIFHEHDFTSFAHEYTDVMGGAMNQSDGQKSCRLLLLDPAAASGEITTYPAGTRHFYLVELRPTFSPPANITHPALPAGLLGFDVRDGSGSYHIAFNPSAVAITVATAGQLHRSGERHRADWLKEAGPVESVAPIPAPASFPLSPGEILFTSEK